MIVHSLLVKVPLPGIHLRRSAPKPSTKFAVILQRRSICSESLVIRGLVHRNSSDRSTFVISMNFCTVQYFIVDKRYNLMN